MEEVFFYVVLFNLLEECQYVTMDVTYNAYRGMQLIMHIGECLCEGVDV
jgi:hypothetical protein